jgi:hypothetical protein
VNLKSGDWTGDFDNIKCYDQLKVNAVLHWIDGKTHLGTGKAVVPKIFGMKPDWAYGGRHLSLVAAPGHEYPRCSHLARE